MLWVALRKRCLHLRFTLNASFGRRFIALDFRCRSKEWLKICSYIFVGYVSKSGIVSRQDNYLHRMVHIRAFCQSRNYPDFFLDSPKDGSSIVTNPVKLLEILEAINEKKHYDRGIEMFEDFTKARPDWFKQWPAQKIAAQILHFYLQTGSYDKICSVYDELRREGFTHGEGIYATMIKCCIAMHDMPKALSFLKELKDGGLRNVRIYRNIIIAFINDDKFDMAFELFKEMQHYEFYQKTRKQFKDQNMLSSLLISASAGSKRYDGRNYCDRNLRLEAVSNSLSYLHNRSITVSAKLKNAIMKAVNTFSDDFSVEIVNRDQINKKDPKESSHTQVTTGDVELFAKLFRQSKKSGKFLVEEEKLRDFVAKYGPFSTIVDGANVMLARKVPANNKPTELTGKNILDVLKSFRNSFHLDKSLVIIPSTMEKRSMFTESQCAEQLKREYHAEIYITEEIPDDVAILLAALYNDVYLKSDGLPKISMLITNDSLRDHISVIGGQEQLKLKSWLQSKQLNFSFDCNDEIAINDSTLPIRKDSNRWSLLLENGEILIAMKK